jgi:probable phosphoglycerate mutase
MRLILFRHGNTFDTGQKPYWVGKSEDLPLVSQGIVQAQKAAAVLREFAVVPQGLYCSSLKRTRQFADTLKKSCNWKSSIIEDPRLDELDYGVWSGLTSEEIAARGWVIDLQQWNDRSVWPLSGDWEGSPELLQAETDDFVQDLRKIYGKDATIVSVTSNGRMRFFLSLDDVAFRYAIAREKVKVKTGHAVIIDISSKSYSIKGWDMSAQDLAAFFAEES